MRRICLVFVVIFLSLLCSCSNKIDHQNDLQINETEYIKEFYDCGIAMNDNLEGIFLFEKDKVIFNKTEFHDNGKAYLTYFYGDVLSNSFFQKTGVSIEYDHSVVSTAYYDPKIDKDLICVMDENDDGIINIKKYTFQGDLYEAISFSEAELEGTHVLSFCINEEGKIFILTKAGVYLYIVSKGIEKLEEIEGVTYKEIFLVDQNPCCIVIETKAENNQKAILYNADGSIIKVTEVPSQSFLFSCQEKILFYEYKKIYEMEKDLSTYEKVLDFSHEKDFFENMNAVVKKEGKYGILYKSLADGAYRTVLFDTTRKMEKDKKEVIIYDPTGVMEFYCPISIIDSFNEINQNYHVSIKEYERDLNYVLLSEKKPDLVFLTDTGIDVLGKSGYLEDLTPFIDRNYNNMEDELLNNIFQKISYGDYLFAIPRLIEFCTFCGYESKVGKNTGWTVEEFLGWLEDHPDALTDSWMGHPVILKYCMEGSLDHYIDWDQKMAHFNGEDFGEMLKMIKSIKVNQSEGYVSAEKGDVMCLTFSGMGDLFRRRNEYDSFVCKGLPTTDGREKHLLNYNTFSILSQSENKEGAFEFIKYFIHYRYGKNMGFFTDKSIFEKYIEINSRDYWPTRDGQGLEAIGQPEQEMFWKLYMNSEKENLDSSKIIDIILEEAKDYFIANKSLEAVTDIIQNRIQLLLDEK